MEIDPNKPLWQLTVSEFMELQQKTMLPPPEKEEAYLTTAQAAEYVNVGKITIWRWQKAGYLPVVRVGGVLRFRKSDLDNIQNR